MPSQEKTYTSFIIVFFVLFTLMFLYFIIKSYSIDRAGIMQEGELGFYKKEIYSFIFWLAVVIILVVYSYMNDIEILWFLQTSVIQLLSLGAMIIASYCLLSLLVLSLTNRKQLSIAFNKIKL